MRHIPYILAALMLGAALSRAAETVDSCPYEGLGKMECARVQAIIRRWHSKELGSIEVAGRPNVDTGKVNANARDKDREIGPCRYDEGEGRVEIQAAAFRFSDSELGQCLSLAFAQARYHSVEGLWLERLGEHEAWVVKNGALTKVSVDRKLEQTAARMLWTSLAARELESAAAVDSVASTGGRAIAAAGVSSPESSEARFPVAPDAEVHALLGLQ